MKNGYQTVKLAKKPIISEINRIKRIEFAKKYLEKGPEFWDDVVWSDETMIRSNPKNKDKFAKVHFSVSRENWPVNSKSQNEGPTAMFWGCFSKAGGPFGGN